MLSEDHRLLRDSLGSFSEERLAPTAAARGVPGEFPLELLRELGKLGAMGIIVAQEWGGAGMDYSGQIRTGDVEWQGCNPRSSVYHTHQ